LEDCHFELVAAVSRDGFLGRHSGEAVADWSSGEEQARFHACLADHDWAFMGRVTHQQVLRVDRWRVVFSTSTPVPVWRSQRHLWVDPATITLPELIALMASRHAVSRNLILGATRVHDWFLMQRRIDRVQLAIEPLVFGGGIPLFSDQRGMAPLDYLRRQGFDAVSGEQLNDQGTTWHILERATANRQ